MAQPSRSTANAAAGAARQLAAAANGDRGHRSLSVFRLFFAKLA